MQLSPTGTVPRRSILAGVAAGAGFAVAGPSLAGTALAADPPPPFDWDNGNAAFSIVVAEMDPIILNFFNGGDATLVIHLNALIATSLYDSTAPYHPTAVGLHSNLGRRPSSESATNRNKNIALVYAAYRVFLVALPFAAGVQLRAVLTKYGLDPDDDQENKTTPIGIGNLAAKGILEARSDDGTNMLGDVGWSAYNRQPYRDYTNYQPVNTAFELKDPSRWQPGLSFNSSGVYKIQKAATPHFRFARPYTYRDPRAYLLPPPKDSDYQHNRRGYKAQAQHILDRQVALTDEKRAVAEIYNDKILSLGLSLGIAAINAGLTFDEIIQLNLVTAIAEFDTVIACWYNKFVYDAVRPFSAIRLVFGRELITAWGGPALGIVDNLPGSQWESYLKVHDHPEYPSGTACLCAAHSQAARLYLGTDDLDLTWTRAKFASLIEPGFAPANDVAVHISSWTEFARVCRESRVDAGVHFQAAVDIGPSLGTQFGDKGYNFVMSHVRGQAVSS